MNMFINLQLKIQLFRFRTESNFSESESTACADVHLDELEQNQAETNIYKGYVCFVLLSLILFRDFNENRL